MVLVFAVVSICVFGLAEYDIVLFISKEYQIDAVNGKSTLTYCNTGESLVIIPSRVAGFQIEAIGDKAFEDCPGIVDLIIPGTIEIIGKEAFQYCTDLEKIELFHGLELISDSAFCRCYAIKNVCIPGSVSIIGENAFYMCSSLRSVTIEEGCIEIGNDCFGECRELRYIVLPASIKSIGSNAFTGCKYIVLYCKAGSFAEKYAIDNGLDYTLYN